MIVAPYSLISGFAAPGVAGGLVWRHLADVNFAGVAVVAHAVTTPFNRFLDDGLGVALLISKGKIRFLW
ncbi:hypothetical protein DIT71_02390 [Marinobacter vulgaris]|uniref:Uncharacterized protein n=1 Tax=Marinobacter vulgaris TaxID=1928331 RepID=A0A2V3ZQA0_9GAMM|nr:hypothetical protein DIT71_02390 [Marinobacter vulgaris]